MKLASLCIIAAMTGTTAYAASNTTTFTAHVINKTGEKIYFLHGGVNNPNDPLVCATLTSNQPNTKQKATFSLPAKLFPVHPDGSADVMTNFALASGSKSCAQASSTPLTCSNDQPYIKYGGVRFDNYGSKSGANIVTLTKSANGTYTCTLQNNPYSTVEENIPYRQLNAGQNYLPPGGGIANGTHPLPTRSYPLLTLSDYKGSA